MRVKLLLGGMAVCAALFAANARAVLTIKITQGAEGAQPIAVVPFGWSGGGPGAPENMGAIIAADLARTGQFKPIATADLPARPDRPEAVNFSDWRLLGTSNLLIGSVAPAPGGRFKVRFRLFDVFQASQIIGYTLDAGAGQLRRIAHQVSDIVYEKLTGTRGAFDTRIAYVTELDTASGKRYALRIADSDGFNAHTILESSQPMLSPAWAPKGERLAYVSYEGGQPRIYVQNLASGKRRMVAGFPGLNGAPAWSPDGTRLAMTLSKDGNAEIYVYFIGSRRLQRLTANTSIDTEPAWSPDGESLVFTSNRGGTPQIYRMPSGGGRATRLTFEGNYNARASYAPGGKKLVLVHNDRGAFRIALLDLQTTALTVLTQSNLDESPSFAPNGVMILYATTDAAGAALAADSIDGRVRQRLALQDGKVREPAWSPFNAR